MGIRYPVIVLNFKAYAEALGVRAVQLAKIADNVSRDCGVTVVVCPNIIDLRKVVESVSIPVFAQHCDPHNMGSYTGSVVAEALKEAGVYGSLLNHSEKRLGLSEISSAVQKLLSLGLMPVVCADDVQAVKAASALGPEAVAVEPPELIGTGISVSTAKPEVITKTVEVVRKIAPEVHVLCGAGVSRPEDVRRAVELGAEGVLLSSAYVKSSDPKDMLRKMCEAALI